MTTQTDKPALAAEVDRLRAAILEQSRVADAWLNRYSAALGDVDRLHEVNAALVEALQMFLIKKPLSELLEYAEQCEQTARAALAKAAK